MTFCFRLWYGMKYGSSISGPKQKLHLWSYQLSERSSKQLPLLVKCCSQLSGTPKEICCWTFWRLKPSMLCSTVTHSRNWKRQFEKSRSGILMLDENAKPYSAMVTENHIAILVWEHLHHMPYSSDLKLSDFHQFPAFKKNLGRRCFGNNAEVKQAIKWFFHIQTLSLFWRAFWSLSNSMTNVSMYLVLT